MNTYNILKLGVCFSIFFYERNRGILKVENQYKELLSASYDSYLDFLKIIQRLRELADNGNRSNGIVMINEDRFKTFVNHAFDVEETFGKTLAKHVKSNVVVRELAKDDVDSLYGHQKVTDDVPQYDLSKLDPSKSAPDGGDFENQLERGAGTYEGQYPQLMVQNDVLNDTGGSVDATKDISISNQLNAGSDSNVSSGNDLQAKIDKNSVFPDLAIKKEVENSADEKKAHQESPESVNSQKEKDKGGKEEETKEEDKGENKEKDDKEDPDDGAPIVLTHMGAENPSGTERSNKDIEDSSIKFDKESEEADKELQASSKKHTANVGNMVNNSLDQHEGNLAVSSSSSQTSAEPAGASPIVSDGSTSKSEESPEDRTENALSYGLETSESTDSDSNEGSESDNGKSSSPFGFTQSKEGSEASATDDSDDDSESGFGVGIEDNMDDLGDSDEFNLDANLSDDEDD